MYRITRVCMLMVALGLGLIWFSSRPTPVQAACFFSKVGWLDQDNKNQLFNDFQATNNRLYSVVVNYEHCDPSTKIYMKVNGQPIDADGNTTGQEEQVPDLWGQTNYTPVKFDITFVNDQRRSPANVFAPGFRYRPCVGESPDTLGKYCGAWAIAGTVAAAATGPCKLTPFWRSDTDPASGGGYSDDRTAKLGAQYRMVVDYENCKDKTIAVKMNLAALNSDGSYGDEFQQFQDTFVASSNTKGQKQFPFSFNKSGKYRFYTWIDGQESATQKPSSFTSVAGNVSAGDTTTGDKASSDTSGEETQADSSAGGSSDAPGNLVNPIDAPDLLTLFLKIVRALLILIGLLATAFIIIGGFRMVASQGNTESLTKAKATVTWAILGLAVALLSFSMIAIVQNLLKVK